MKQKSDIVIVDKFSTGTRVKALHVFGTPHDKFKVELGGITQGILEEDIRVGGKISISPMTSGDITGITVTTDERLLVSTKSSRYVIERIAT